MDNKLVSIGVLTGKNTATADASIVFRDSSIVIINKDTTVNIDTNSTLRSQGDPTFVYTFHSNTNLNDISYYLFDHLGNTRVVFKPELTDGSVVLREDFNKASRFANEVGDEFIGSSPCVGCPNWKGYNNLITNVSYDNGRIRCEENPIYTNIYYGLTMPFPTENLKTYHVSFDYDSDGSQLTCGASIRVEISNGTVVNGTQIVGFSTSNSHIEFTFQAQGTVHRLNMIARNTDPSVFPKHFYIDNVEIKEVGASASCDVAYTLEYAADYYPYGKILREFQNGLGAEKYLTTHHERDTETGLDYRGARYYDSDVARFLSLDPLAMKFANLSAYNYVSGNPIHFIDPDGRKPGDFLSESGKYLGNDGKDDGKVYVVKTQTSDFEEGVSGAGLSYKDARKTAKFIKKNSGNTEAFESNGSAYNNSVEIEGNSGTRTAMVNAVSGDDGKGGTSDNNNREYGGSVMINGKVIAGEPGTVTTPKEGASFSNFQFGDKTRFHSHPSGTITTSTGGLDPFGSSNTIGSTSTTTYRQPPSSWDIKNSGEALRYVFGKGSGKVYIYNNKGVQATLPLNSFGSYK